VMCALLRYHEALKGSSLPTFRDNLTVPFSRVKKLQSFFLDFLTHVDRTERLFGNVGETSV
jgi:hypothetical protein